MPTTHAVREINVKDVLDPSGIVYRHLDDRYQELEELAYLVVDLLERKIIFISLSRDEANAVCSDGNKGRLQPGTTRYELR